MILRQVTRPAVRPVIRSVIDGGSGRSLEQQIRALFAAGEQGAWLDPSDTSTLFQDSAGTVPGALNQPVGLVLDKSKRLELGPELVVNGDFSDGTTRWTLFTGVSVSDGRLAFNTTSNEGASQPDVASAGVVGRVYQIEFDLISYTRGSPQILFGDSTFNYVSTSLGRKRLILTLKSGGIFQIRAGFFGVGGECVIDNISVRELKGNHASQSSTLSRPTSRAGYLEFDRADDSLAGATGGGGTTGILISAGIRASGAGTARTIWTDRGTNAGYRLSINASNQLVLSAGNGSAHVECVGDTVTAGTDYVVTGWHDGVNLRVQVNAETAAQQSFAAATAGTAGYTVAKDNGAASGFFGDRLYGLQYFRGTPLTDSERAIVRRYLAKQAGVTL